MTLNIAIAIQLAPQARTVLLHLEKRGSISPLEAQGTYGITRLAARIHDLKQAGYPVKAEMRKDAAGKPYARYHVAA